MSSWASARAPSMKLDLRRRRKGLPIRYMPGESLSARDCTVDMALGSIEGG